MNGTIRLIMDGKLTRIPVEVGARAKPADEYTRRQGGRIFEECCYAIDNYLGHTTSPQYTALVTFEGTSFWLEIISESSELGGTKLVAESYR